MADSRGHSKSKHGNYIHIFTEVETKVTTAFHLYNKEARRELNIAVEGRTLPFCSEPTYLEIKLDRSLSYRQHLESSNKKLTARVVLDF